MAFRYRRPSITAVERAAATLSTALMAEAERLRADLGHSAHQGAQELEHDAIRVGGMASRVKALRRNR